MQLSMDVLLLLAMTGAFLVYFESPDNKSGHSVKSSDLGSGATAFALCQVIDVPIFLMISYTRDAGKMINYCLISVCGILVSFAVGAIIAMTVNYCAEFTVVWIMNFCVFLAVEALILHPIYAMAVYIATKRTSERLGYRSKQEIENTVDLGNSGISSAYGKKDFDEQTPLPNDREPVIRFDIAKI